MTFNISGRAMGVIMGSDLYQNPDPEPDVVEASEALRYGDVSRRGKGETHLIITSPAAATVIMEYCEVAGQGLASQRDPEAKQDGHALLVVSGRIMWKLRELAGPVRRCLRCDKDMSSEMGVTAFARLGHRFVPVAGVLLCLPCGGNGANTLSPEEVRAAGPRE